MLSRSAIFATVLLSAPPAVADGWTGPDKNEHLVVGAGLAGNGYLLARGLGADEDGAAVSGLALAAAGGLAKESLDALGLGTPSGKDLVWSVAGGLIGAGLTWILDLLTGD